MPDDQSSTSLPPDDGPMSDSSGGLPAAGGESDSAGPSRRLATDEQKTVISRRGPSDLPRPARMTPNELGAALEGERLGQIELEEFVGGGGMGAVFRGVDTSLGRTVAVKVVSRDTDEDTLRRFRNEAQSAARLDHPNIARVYYVGEDRGWNYIVFEFIEGVNIRDLVEHKGPLSLDDAIGYSLQVCEALEHASQRDVIHRDIKPSNILVTADGHAKLVDMGLARLHQVESSADDLTASGVTLGTFDYISPEQARDPRNTDVRSDLYSLGCTFYYMLTGQPPFPVGTVLQKLLSHSSDNRPDPREIRPDLPEQVSRIVRKMLAKQPGHRYQTPAELIGELIVLAQHLGLSSGRSTMWIAAHTARPSLFAQHVPWLAPVLALIGAVVAVEAVGRSRSVDETWRAPRFSGIYAPALVDDRAPPGDSARVRAPAPITPTPEGIPTDGAAQRTDAGTSGRTAPANGSAAASGSTGAAPAEAPAAESTTTRPPAASGLSGDEMPTVMPPDPDNPFTPPEPAPNMDGVRLLVVGAEPADHPENPAAMRTMKSFASAVELAARSPGIDEILVNIDGPVPLDRPHLDLRLATRSDAPLVIRAGDGFRPVLAFRPTDGDYSGTLNPAMIRVTGGELTWVGIHFEMELASGLRKLGWSLFELDDVRDVSLAGCTMTVRNVRDDGTIAHQGVAFVSLAEPEAAQSMDDDATSAVTDVPRIGLDRCSLRGQATLVRAARAVPFWLDWHQGVLVTSERLVELGDAPGDVTQQPDIEVALREVVAIVGQGLCLTSLGMNNSAGSSLPAQRFRLSDCVIATYSREAPLFEQRGGMDSFPDRRYPFIEGSGNLYLNCDVVWRIVPLGERDEYTFKVLQTTNPLWFNDRSAPPPMTAWDRPSLQSAHLEHQITLHTLSRGDDTLKRRVELKVDVSGLPEFAGSDGPSLRD